MTEAELTEALDAAKARVRDGDTSEEALADLDAVKAALHEARATRRINPDAPASADDGVAAPEPVQVTTEGG